MLRTGGARACLAQKFVRPSAMSRTGATSLRAEVILPCKNTQRECKNTQRFLRTMHCVGNGIGFKR
jgi:hypothetical protein